MKKKLRHYPFVEPSIALEIERKGWSIPYHALYEKGYSYNGKKFRAKLQKFDKHSIKDTINFISNPKWIKEFEKRPRMFLSFDIPVWCVCAPTYDEIIDWLFEKHKIFISFHYDNKLGQDYSWDFFYKDGLLCRCNDWFSTPYEAKENCIYFLLKSLNIYSDVK